MFENVLVGVDGRSYGRDAIALATRLAGSGAKLTLAHVRPGEFHPLTAGVPGVLEQEREESLALPESERAEAAVKAELGSVAAASPGAGLRRQGEAQGAALLVVGSCSRSAFGRAMLGDDTRAALNGAPCAVAVASHGSAEHHTAISNIGV